MSNRNENFVRQKELVQEMNIMDDVLFAKVAEDIPAIEEILSVLLQEEIELRWTRSQVF